jgi:hypothetical protein
MPTWIVAPLLTGDHPGYSQVSARVKFAGLDFIVSTGEIAQFPPHLLVPIGSLRDYEDEIRRALDRLFTGF